MASVTNVERFNTYLNCLRQEYELLANVTKSSSSAFNIYLSNLRGEFEIRGVELENYKKKGSVRFS